MFRLIAVLLVLIVCLVPTVSLTAQGTGTIEGVAAGTRGGLPNATVQVIDVQGRLVSKVITDTAGRFRITNLPPGTFIVQTVDASGFVIGTAPAVLSAGAMTATVTLSTTAAATAGAATAAGGAAAAGGAGAAGSASAGTAAAGAGGLSTAAVIGGVLTAAAVAGTVAVVQTTTNASPSR